MRFITGAWRRVEGSEVQVGRTDYSHRTKVREVLWRRFKRVVSPSYGTSAEAHGLLPWNQALSAAAVESRLRGIA